jgi:hypothetical protein
MIMIYVNAMEGYLSPATGPFQAGAATSTVATGL